MKKLVATLMLSLLLLGCAVGNKGLAAEKPLVVVSFYPLEYIVRVLAGDQLDLVNLSSGFDVHEYNLKPSDLVAISNASLFISSGTVLEPWVNSLSIDNS